MESIGDPGDSIVIEAATSVEEDLVEAMGRLLPQLSPTAPAPSATELCAMIASPAVTLLIARDLRSDGWIVGVLTLVVASVPTGVRGWIEDVVVDDAARGRGVGKALCREALRVAAARGARSVDLTSRPAREAANRLYRRLGFRLRDTNAYRYDVAGEEHER